MEHFIFNSNKSFSFEFCNDVIANLNNNSLEKIDASNNAFISKENKSHILKQIWRKDVEYCDFLNGKFAKFSNFPASQELLNISYKRISPNEIQNCNKLIFNHIISVNIASTIQFILFLNTGGNIVFWNNYEMQIHSGLLLLFPTSWCFPYNFNNITNEIHCIQGIMT